MDTHSQDRHIICRNTCSPQRILSIVPSRWPSSPWCMETAVEVPQNVLERYCEPLSVPPLPRGRGMDIVTSYWFLWFGSLGSPDFCSCLGWFCINCAKASNKAADVIVYIL
mmetsp:Transcript_66804/g.159862  ORF Transcript_66804/g.159862 Transcript_66804/m.159862 type:complete len:111 (+) Transcript_66804:262-594(+)